VSFLSRIIVGLFGPLRALRQDDAAAAPVVVATPPNAAPRGRDMWPAKAVAVLDRHAAELRRNPAPPYVAKVDAALAVLKQPMRSHIQAQIGMGQRLRTLREGENEVAWTFDQYQLAEGDAGIKTVVEAIYSEVYLDVSEDAAASIVRQWERDFWRRRRRLDFINSLPAARESHVTEIETGRLIFPRVVELGKGGRIEIERNLCGPIIQRDPVGMLNRATMVKAGWKLRSGWWIVQAEGVPPEGGGDGGAALPAAFGPGI